MRVRHEYLAVSLVVLYYLFSTKQGHSLQTDVVFDDKDFYLKQTNCLKKVRNAVALFSHKPTGHELIPHSETESVTHSLLASVSYVLI